MVWGCFYPGKKRNTHSSSRRQQHYSQVQSNPSRARTPITLRGKFLISFSAAQPLSSLLPSVHPSSAVAGPAIKVDIILRRTRSYKKDVYRPKCGLKAFFQQDNASLSTPLELSRNSLRNTKFLWHRIHHALLTSILSNMHGFC